MDHSGLLKLQSWGGKTFFVAKRKMKVFLDEIKICLWVSGEQFHSPALQERMEPRIWMFLTHTHSNTFYGYCELTGCQVLADWLHLVSLQKPSCIFFSVLISLWPLFSLHLLKQKQKAPKIISIYWILYLDWCRCCLEQNSTEYVN